MTGRTTSLTGVTIPDVPSNVMSHPEPDVVPGEELKGLGLATVPCAGHIVMLLQEVET